MCKEQALSTRGAVLRRAPQRPNTYLTQKQPERTLLLTRRDEQHFAKAWADAIATRSQSRSDPRQPAGRKFASLQPHPTPRCGRVLARSGGAEALGLLWTLSATRSADAAPPPHSLRAAAVRQSCSVPCHPLEDGPRSWRMALRAAGWLLRFGAAAL